MKLSDAALKRRDELLWKFCGDQAYQDAGDHEDYYNEGYEAGYVFAKEESKKEVEALKAKLDKAMECMKDVRSELTNAENNIDHGWCIDQICQTLSELGE